MKSLKIIGLKIIDFLTLLNKGGRQIDLTKYPALTIEDVEGHWKSWAFKLDDLMRIYFKEQGFDDHPNRDFEDLPFYHRVSIYWTSQVFGDDLDYYTHHSEDVIETINYIKIQEHF